MKYVLLLLSIFSIQLTTFGQIEKPVTVPKPEEVTNIQISHQEGDPPIFTENSLLAILPHLVPGVDQCYDFYCGGRVNQNGTLTLKNGALMEWQTCTGDSLLLSNGKGKKPSLFFTVGEKVAKRLTMPDARD